MRSTIKLAAMIILPLSLPALQAFAAETAVITLSCDAKVTDLKASDAKPELLPNVGVVVNFTEHTVSFNGYVIPITGVDAANVSFDGDVKPQYRGTPLGKTTVSGSVDRVTGAMTATIMNSVTASTWDLVCKPTNRLF